MRSPEYDPEQQAQLLDIAYASIEHGLQRGAPLLPAFERLHATLAARRASFVSLHRHGELRGCIGSLQASKPLAEDVAYSAYQAAFRDPRFPPLNQLELTTLDIEVSVLSPLEKLTVVDERELLATIEPGVDGLVLEDTHRRATFLPVVWQSLPSPTAFVEHLKAKGGWPQDYWASDMRVYRYHTETFERAA
jgi:AmmeMemoRadiSam system protein A